MRTIHAFIDVTIGGEARDQHARLALCVEQMPDVSRVHDVEHAVTHDHFVRTRRLAKNLTQLLGRLDLVLILV